MAFPIKSPLWGGKEIFGYEGDGKTPFVGVAKFRLKNSCSVQLVYLQGKPVVTIPFKLIEEAQQKGWVGKNGSLDMVYFPQEKLLEHTLF